MSEILRFPKVPELDFLKEIAEDITNPFDGERILNIYRYLVWSRRYQLVHAMSPEHRVAYGFLLKYHRLMMNMDIPPHEQALIDEAREALAASNAAIKRKKGQPWPVEKK